MPEWRMNDFLLSFSVFYNGCQTAKLRYVSFLRVQIFVCLFLFVFSSEKSYIDNHLGKDIFILCCLT